MEKALRDFVRVLAVPIRVSTGHEVDIVNLKVEFTRNVPNNLTELVDTVTKLNGTVDKETLLSLLPFIDNPKEVLEKLEAENKKQNIEADSNNLFSNFGSFFEGSTQTEGNTEE